MSKGAGAAVIVPLYLYPVSEATWQPLYQAISDYPDLHFFIIVNPNSGPGVDPDGWLPDKHYSREVPRLSGNSNVTIIGYVRVDYCRRSSNEVLEDIRKYANWSGIMSDDASSSGQTGLDSPVGSIQFAVHGIFFDEVPNIWKPDDAAYLENIGTLVKRVVGIVGNRVIFHNCGTVPDSEYPLFWRGMYRNRKDSQGRRLSRLANSRDTHIPRREPGDCRTILGAPDVTVVFEESSALWHEESTQRRLEDLLQYKRENCSYMIHSVPEALIKTLVSEMKRRGAYLFITDLQERYYESFGSSWREFVSIMADGQDEEDNLLITIDSRSTWIKNIARDTLKGLSCTLL